MIRKTKRHLAREANGEALREESGIGQSLTGGPIETLDTNEI